MRVLILGGNGQVAFELRRAAWPAGTLPTIAGRPDFDMTRPETLEPVLAATAPEVVINATAHTAVDKAESEPDLAFAINRDGPARLAELCAGRGIPLLHISTDYVFDGSGDAPHAEDEPTAPLGVYGASKAAGEEAVRAALPRHLILRTSWVYGAHGNNFVKTMLRLGAEREELRVVSDQHGSPTAAADIAETLVRLAVRATDTGPVAWGTYHYAGTGFTTWYDLAEHVFQAQERATGRRPRLIPIATADYPSPARRPANSRLDCSRIARAFGIVGRPWQEGVDRVLAELAASRFPGL